MRLVWHMKCKATVMASTHDQSSPFSAPLQNSGLTTRELWRWTPRRIGPRFAWLDHDHILIVDGPLSERRFEVNTDIRADTAMLRLREDGDFAGLVRIERSPSGSGVILSNAAVGLRYRRSGLAAIMTWCAFRELLAEQESATFRIRIARSAKRRSTDTEVPYIGVGVIAARLGLRPEFPVERLLHEANIVGISVLPGGTDSPPALRITLKSHPFMFVAVALNPDTMRPLTDCGPYLQLGRDGRQIQSWLSQGLLLVDEDYCLGESGIERFVNALATDDEEAAQFRSKIRPL
jgi:hypothetical protein